MGLDLHALADAANDLHRIAEALEEIAAHLRRREDHETDNERRKADARSDS